MRTPVVVSSEEPSDLIPPDPDFNLHPKNGINTKELVLLFCSPITKVATNHSPMI